MSKEGFFKQYLGDGVYADYDGYHIVLTTPREYDITHYIKLEPEVLDSFMHYVANLKQQLGHPPPKQHKGE